MRHSNGRRALVRLAGVGLAVAAVAVMGGLGLRGSLGPHVRIDAALAGAVAPSTTAPQYSIEQAISDRAQQTTIAFDALGFLTGSLGTDSFFPPGKVADFWGFQYLRDNDPSAMGHNTDFLTKASLNMYGVLTSEQRQRLTLLAEGQVDAIDEYGYKRFVLMAAFRRLLEGDLPAGTTALDQDAVKACSAALYRLDGEISYERAAVMGSVLSSLSDEQRASLDAMVGKGMLEWPDATEPEDMRGLSRDEKVAVMTYSGDMLSWYAGSVDADVYFCPERHGTYFGSFYLKDGPAVGTPGYNIPTTMTGDMGARFVAALDARQAALVSGLVEAQREDLLGIVDVRRSVAEKLRGFMAGDQVDEAAVMSLMEHYGELDGDIVYRYATAFSAVGKTLTAGQTTQLMALREEMLGDLSPDGAFLYSQAIPMPATPDTDFLFAKGKTTAQTTRISPSSALRGATVTITGTRFGAKRGAGIVRFGATKCTRYLSWSATRIRCKVPAAAAYGALAVTVRTGRGTSATMSFTVAEPEATPTPTPSPVTEPFTLTSSAFQDGGTLPVVYTGDGAGLSPPLAWAGAPAGTIGFAVTMTTLALDGLKWNWVLYDIPADVTALAESTAGVGTVGLSSDGPELRYYPPMSKGPGAKTYMFTVYALSAAPVFDVPAAEVSGAILTSAISQTTIASSRLSVTYTR